MRHGSCTPISHIAQEQLRGLPAARSSPTALHGACTISASRHRLPTMCSTGEALNLFSRSHFHVTVTAMLACVSLTIPGAARQAMSQPA